MLVNVLLLCCCVLPADSARSHAHAQSPYKRAHTHLNSLSTRSLLYHTAPYLSESNKRVPHPPASAPRSLTFLPTANCPSDLSTDLLTLPGISEPFPKVFDPAGFATKVS